jgi:hypothetical protein
MEQLRNHTFHIPVLGLAFSIDTPIRVARFGISSVISIGDDILIEHMRKHYSLMHGEPYSAIALKEYDYRARRITAYLNLVQKIVHSQLTTLRTSPFVRGSEIEKYFEMLPDTSPLHRMYVQMVQSSDVWQRSALQAELRRNIVAGDIDVNIMTKVDAMATNKKGETLPPEFSNALASLRGFAESNLSSSVVLSAGLNPRLFSYLGRRPEFLPDAKGKLKKKVTVKVSDFRSAYIQGKLLAKKGIWVSEYRVESGLNCGGHAFATDGFLMGPILEEFKEQRPALLSELRQIYDVAMKERGIDSTAFTLATRVTAQGGIGTAQEDEFLRSYYRLDGTGWGSPFLLVPEATNVDDDTRARLVRARSEDYYLSNASPLGIPFNNLRDTTSEQQLRQRAEEGEPGSPCGKKFLVSNTEFTKEPICTASREYQKLKLHQIKGLGLPSDELQRRIDAVLEKVCLCEDLAAAAVMNNATNGKSEPPRRAVAICPGPNLAYFTRIASLEEMVGHIYGRIQLITDQHRPNMFVNELRLYVEYLRNELQKRIDSLTTREEKYYVTFKANLLDGIAYYQSLIEEFVHESERYRESMRIQIEELEQELLSIVMPEPCPVEA